jgi:hypothetical protein
MVPPRSKSRCGRAPVVRGTYNASTSYISRTCCSSAALGRSNASIGDLVECGFISYSIDGNSEPNDVLEQESEMPIFDRGRVPRVLRPIKAALNRKNGSARDPEPSSIQEKTETRRRDSDGKQIAELLQMLESRDREIARLKTKLLTSGARAQDGSMDPRNVIWMFGSGRTGSNWLGRMMADIEDHAVWQEPQVGSLFAFYYNHSSTSHDREHFILSSPCKETWLSSIRSFVLEGANARFPAIAEQGYLVIREPTGSRGAPLLMEALPESRMIFLIRDPRDVMASVLDGSGKGGWLSKREFGEKWKRQFGSADQDPDTFVRSRSDRYLRQIGKTKQAYEAHKGHKVLVKYEDLRSDALETMKRIYNTLEIDVDENGLAQAVKQHAWENIPEEKKGKGRFHRKATPGGWREDLTPQQVKIVEEITSPLIDEYYPA